jgi:hypothetical protein
VLIVEDDKAIADLLATAINDERGYEAFGREYSQALPDRGIATYVKKPFDLDELVRFVKGLVPSGGDPKPAA